MYDERRRVKGENNVVGEANKEFGEVSPQKVRDGGGIKGV